MAEEHIGSLVLIDCGPALGTYQGRVSHVEPVLQTITLENPLRNGLPYQVPKVTLRADDIIDLKVLQLANEFEQMLNSVLSSCQGTQKSSEPLVHLFEEKRQAPTAQNQVVQGEPSVNYAQVASRGKTKVASKLQHQQGPFPTAVIDHRKKHAKSSSPNSARPKSRPDESRLDGYSSGSDGRRHHEEHQQKHRPLSDLCEPLDFELMSTDFDFEANLAKFEKLPRAPEHVNVALSSMKKQAAMIDNLFQNLDGATPSKTLATTTTFSPSKKNISHDENVVHDPARVYVNAKRAWRYLTDDNLEIQALTAAQKKELFDKASNGWITQDGFSFALANAALYLCFQMLKEKNVSPGKLAIYIVYSDALSVSRQIAKQLSRYLVNRGHMVNWILTNAVGFYDKEPGVSVLSEFSRHNLVMSQNSFVFVIGRQGILADDVSSWLMKYSSVDTLFVESDWQSIQSFVNNGDTMAKLEINGGKLVEVPSQALLFWQLPCEDVDTDLKTPVYICDTNMPSHFLHSELPKITKKSKLYKFPFTQNHVAKLRKL